MKVILLQNIKTLGKLGEVINVRSGYGRNYLLPRGIAILANKNNVTYFEQKRHELEQAANEQLASAKTRAEFIDGKRFSIVRLASEEGKLYGSVGVKEIAEAIAKNGGSVQKQEILMPNGPIKVVGEHAVEVRMHHGDAIAKITIDVLAEK